MAFEFRWILFLGFIATSLVLIIISAALSPDFYIIKFIIALLAVMLDLGAMASRYYTYLFSPLTKMKGKKLVIDSNEPYIMAPSGNAIMKRDGDLIYATVYVKIPVYRSGTEMQDQEKIDFAATFGKLLTIIKEPFRLGTQLYVLDKDEYIDKIRTRLNEAEDRYNQMINREGETNTSQRKEVSPEAERVRGEVTMWRNMLESVTKAKSHSMVSYAEISAVGNTEEQAVNFAVSKGDELAAGISATMGISASIVTEKELLQLIEPDKMIPIANLNEQITVRSRGQV